jgi:hypothetical protein
MLERELFGSRALGKSSFLRYGELSGVRRRAAECAAPASAEAADASTAFDGEAEFRALAVTVGSAGTRQGSWLRDNLR